MPIEAMFVENNDVNFGIESLKELTMVSNKLSLQPKTMISHFDGLTQFSYRYNVSTPDDSFHKFVQATINGENIAGEYHHHVNPPNTLYLIKHKFHNYYKYVFKAKKNYIPAGVI